IEHRNSCRRKRKGKVYFKGNVVVSFIGLKTKVGGKNMEPTKKDWKLYRERIGDWQEAYMEKLVQKYVEYLQENLPASDKFWELENRIKNDKKKPGVLIEVRKSSMIWDIVRLIHDEVVTVKDLEGFSNELVEAVELILNR
ncbi:hypothetical protein, partial [[Ruminococcus] lactaris]|uniref:hypothetical protein n=2 Tax=[Ruminococcus] lactaris TaxID=46228 RepID=UPI002ED13771